MEVYIGTKLVCAAPAWRVTIHGQTHYVEKQGNVQGIPAVAGLEDGYKVVYADGYESWSPKEVFEEAYRPVDGLNFGMALEAAKKGYRIARKGWNGKGMYVFLAMSESMHTDANLSEFADDGVTMNDMLVLRTANAELQPGWLASQSDMLSDDWYILKED